MRVIDQHMDGIAPETISTAGATNLINSRSERCSADDSQIAAIRTRLWFGQMVSEGDARF